MGYPLFAHRNQEVVKILGRFVIGSPSYWNGRVMTVPQECVICGLVYVDEQNLGDLGHSTTQPRADPAEERAAITGNNVEKDNDVETLDLPSPAELKGTVMITPAAIRLAVRSGVFYLLKRLKPVRRIRYPTSDLRRRATRGKHVHQTHFIALSYTHSSRGLPSTHSFTQALDAVRFTYLIAGIPH